MMTDQRASPSAPEARSSFPTTHWSVVLNAGAGSESQVRAALEILCRQYWYPLYTYVRRHGRSHHEAEDAIQEFLARLLERDAMACARPERGRFRTFLLTALRNFLTNEWHRSQTARRGGGAVISVDWQSADERFSRERIDDTLSAEQAFDRAWAQQLMERAVGELRSEYEKRGQQKLLAVLGPLVWGNDREGTHASHAAQLAMTPHAFTVALQRLRQRLGERLRQAVAETVEDSADIDADLRYLITTLRHE